MESVLLEAHRLAYGDRNVDYGHPYHDLTRTSNMVNALLEGKPMTAERWAMCMILAKLSRQMNRPKRDNMTDIGGYADCAQRILDFIEDMERKESPNGTEATSTEDAESNLDGVPPGRKTVESSLRAARHYSQETV